MWTLSSGKDALQYTVSLSARGNRGRVVMPRDLRETLDELELVLDLAALVGAVLLGPVVC